MISKCKLVTTLALAVALIGISSTMMHTVKADTNCSDDGLRCSGDGNNQKITNPDDGHFSFSEQGNHGNIVTGGPGRTTCEQNSGCEINGQGINNGNSGDPSSNSHSKNN